MNIRQYILLFTCFFVFYGMPASAQEEYRQHEVLPPDMPEEALEEMLSNEDLPEEIRREIEESLRARESEIASEAPDLHQQVKPEVTGGSTPNKISLDLKGVDIIDVLKMLSARSNLNIVAGRNVKGKVTLFLKDVNIWDAFEIILAANNLAYDKQGDIINVMTERDYEQLYGEKYYNKKEMRVYRLEYARAADIGKALNQAKSKIGKVVINESSNTVVLIDSTRAVSAMENMIKKMDIPVETKVFSLNYAKAEDLKTKLSEILTKGVGTMQVDERTNKIIITDLSKKMPDISSVIEEMDEMHKQVLIEAKIVQIELNDEFRYGVDWKALFRKVGDEGVRVNFDNITDTVFTGGATGGALTITSLASGYIDAAIEVLQTIGKTNVISSPRITVLNNEEARVLVGTNQPYVTSTTTIPEAGSPITAETITYIDVGVTLTVTPTINKDGFVTMKIKPEVSSLGTPLDTASGNEIPVVSTSETETRVMVKDGTTIIIAGLIEDRDIESENKVPILGDIPLIGNFFKSKTVGSISVPEKKELVIFLTPYIVHGTEAFPEAENVWFGDSLTQRELLEQQMSLAVEDLEEKRSIIGEVSPPPPPKKDTTTRLAKGLKWFGWGKEPKKKIEPEEVESKEVKSKKTEPKKTELETTEPAMTKRGTVPEKVKTAKAERSTAPKKVKVDKERKKEAKEIPASQPIFTTTVGGYNVYLESLRSKILWAIKDNYPESLKGRREDVTVLFTLTSDGRLKGKPKVLDEVDKRIAKAVKSAIEKAAPFPPFPKKIKKARETFRITIAYE